MTRFKNLDGSGPNASAMVFRWAVLDRIRGRRRQSPGTAAVPSVVPDVERLRTPPAAGEPGRITWLGHASWLVQLDGTSLLIDPVFGERISYVIRRNGPAPLRPAQLPRIDRTLVSHNHYDHYDRPSVLAAGAPVLTGVGLGKGLPLPVRGLGWWETERIGESVRVSFVPSQHWSRRGLFDVNQTLWGGFVIEGSRSRIYHAGDTAYFEGFAQIGARFPGIDAALLPIGAYDPAWFMEKQHMNPEQAVQAFVDLGAGHFVAMHWGTFKLTDEPLDEPPQRASGIAAGSRANGCTFPPPARRWISPRCCRLAPMRSRNPLADVPPEEFVKARDALVRKLRDEGQAEEARRVAALRRPSTALWIVNQLGRRAPRDVEALIEASQRAQRAQLQGSGSDELRDAMHAQREAMRRLLEEADKAARDAGTALTLELQRRIQDTVQSAATSEPEALRAGALEHELSAAGFGALLSGTAAVAAKAADRKRGFEERADEQKRRVAEKRERMLREREVQRAQQIARRLAVRAEQLERFSAQARQSAEKARTKARKSREAADAAAARLLELRGRS